VLGKVELCGESFRLPVLLETPKIIFLGLLRVFIVPPLISDRSLLWDEFACLLSW
jgi:hypothetical protein